MLGKNQKIAELTEFCRNLSELNDDATGSQEVEVKHPYVIPVAEATDPAKKNSNLVTANQVVLEQNAIGDQRPILEKFPVSSGLEHSAMSSLMDMDLEGQETVKVCPPTGTCIIHVCVHVLHVCQGPYVRTCIYM